MKIEQIAVVAHEVNRAYCQALGDTSQPAWEDAPDWQKSSAINGVNFHIAFPTSTPETSHNEWLKEKLETGWKYGPEKNPEAKEHPCCLPYEKLPVEQRVKDFLFSSVVSAIRAFDN